jgi:hypothetical protein
MERTARGFWSVGCVDGSALEGAGKSSADAKPGITGAWRLGVLWLPLALAGCLGDGDRDEGRGGADRRERVPEVRVDPEDARRVVSVTLTNTVPPPVGAACRAASREESLRVPAICPGVVPDVRIVTERDNPSLSVPFPPDHYELTFNTDVREPRH